MKFFFSILDKLVTNRYFVWIFTTLFVITLLISFFLKINLSNILGTFAYNSYLLEYDIQAKTGGAVSDLKTYWNYIVLLKRDLNNLFILTMGEDVNLINFPLHHLIFSQFNFINSINAYLVSVLVISFLLPLILYHVLKKRFENFDKSIIIVLSSIIFILPVFQYSAIWGNNHNTALIFFSLGILYFNSFIKKNFRDNIKLIFSIIFFTLACYTKQFYVFFFIFLLIYLINKISLNKFILISLFIILCAFPGVYFVILNPILLFGLNQNITNFSSSVLVSASMILFFLIPFIIQTIVNKYDHYKFKLSYLIDKKIFFISITVTLLCSLNFMYNGNIGGGIILKLSYFLFNNPYLVIPASFFGIYFLLYFSQNTLSNYALVVLLLSTFSSGFFIFQKYFEPMFYIIFLNFFDKYKIVQSIEKNNYIILFYFIFYYIGSNYIYFLGL
tara:strand:+ start:370 stop:1704 length:1335 start_codon:yes stop_codon:yes gene_type:complete